MGWCSMFVYANGVALAAGEEASLSGGVGHIGKLEEEVVTNCVGSKRDGRSVLVVVVSIGAVR